MRAPPPDRLQPGRDRRALERTALGAPGGAADAEGPLSAPVLSVELESEGSVAAEVPVGGSRRPRRSVSDRTDPQPGGTSPTALYLLVPGEQARLSGAAATAAVTAAERLSGGRPTVLIDLDPTDAGLSSRFGLGDAEGIVEVLDFGVSLTSVGKAIAPGVHLVPFGAAPEKDRAGYFAHAGWAGLIARASRRGIRLLAYVPPNPELIAPLAGNAGGVLLLAGPDEERRLRSVLDASIFPIVGIIEPPAAAGIGTGGWGTSGSGGSARSKEGRDRSSEPSGSRTGFQADVVAPAAEAAARPGVNAVRAAYTALERPPEASVRNPGNTVSVEPIGSPGPRADGVAPDAAIDSPEPEGTAPPAEKPSGAFARILSSLLGKGGAEEEK